MVAIGDEVRITIQNVPIVINSKIRNKIADNKIYGKIRLMM